MRKSGLAFHCHHDALIEYVYDYAGRVESIKLYKPKEEQELRLKLFQMIPLDRLPQKGLKAYDKAREAYYKTREAYYKARESSDKTREAYDKAREASDKAWEASDKVWEAYYKANEKEIEKLHKELCPDCPWDGKTIFRRY